MWLGLFAFKHVECSQDLWWQFELEGNASRFLRGSVGAASVVLLFALARLIGHAPHEVEPPSEDDLETAGRVIAAQDSTFPYLVYLEDKALIFDERREAFIMYGVQGRTWVALGDPVGPPERVPELIRLFIARCDDYGGTPVFYEVGTKCLHHYADFGLTFVKVGEEARVDLRRFTLDGPRGARFRQLVRRLEKDGGIFRVLPPTRCADGWRNCAQCPTIGCDRGRWPKRASRSDVSIRNMWPGFRPPSSSADDASRRLRHVAGPSRSGGLRRSDASSPRCPAQRDGGALHASDDLGQSRGYRWFVIGMAPMSGFEQSPVAPLWSRAGRLLYEHGTPLYNFQGLRAFKSKFDPVWESRYLVYPGGLALLRIAATCPHWSRAVIGGSFTSRSDSKRAEFGRQFRDTHHKFFEDGLAACQRSPLRPSCSSRRAHSRLPLREQSDRSFERVSSRGHAGGIVVLECLLETREGRRRILEEYVDHILQEIHSPAERRE